MIIHRKRTYISYEIFSSKRCYSCKDYMESVPDIIEYPTLIICKKCDRERNINLLFSSNLSILKFKFKRFILSKGWKKINKLLIILPLTTVLIGGLLKTVYQKETYLIEVGNIVNSFIWVLMILEFKYTSIKKPK